MTELDRLIVALKAESCGGWKHISRLVHRVQLEDVCFLFSTVVPTSYQKLVLVESAYEWVASRREAWNGEDVPRSLTRANVESFDRIEPVLSVEASHDVKDTVEVAYRMSTSGLI